MTVLRAKSVCTKVTEDEFAMFERHANGETLSEWARAVLVKHVTTPPPNEVSLAELFAFRTVTLNLLFKIANDQPVTVEAMQQLIDRSETDKVRRAQERLAPPTGGGHE
jgi:hypothetical protein